MFDNVCSVIVAYNPEEQQLRRLIDSILGQVGFAVVCNNSCFDLDLSDIGRVHVINFHDNLGIAKAQSVGMQWAFDNGADFILQMDQDSEPSLNMVQKLIDAYNDLVCRGYKVGLVGVQDFDKFTGELNKARFKKGRPIVGTSCKEVSETLSSGSLVPKASYDAVGGMDDGLFIDAVDFEYCWRLRSKGFLIARCLDALLGHRLGNGKVKILGFLLVGEPAPIRHYYSFRNTLHLFRRGYVSLYWKFSSVAKLFLKLLFYPLCMSYGMKRLKYMLRGILDGLAGRYGRIDD